MFTVRVVEVGVSLRGRVGSDTSGERVSNVVHRHRFALDLDRLNGGVKYRAEPLRCESPGPTLVVCLP
ncbi:hypothetical protein GCM10009000_037140 [Halobacterium noricense]